MILVTIQDMPTEIVKEIEEKTLRKVVRASESLTEDIPFSEIEILITYGRDVIESNLDKLTSLKWIQIYQTGVEKLPLSQLIKREILVTNIKGIYGTAMSEYVMSKVLFFSREINRFQKNKELKRYDRTELVDEINGKNIGIFGTGLIGKEVAKMAKLFNMRVLGFNSDGRDIEGFDQMYTWESKDEMLKKCDYIVLLLPLLDTTKNFMDQKEFDIIKTSSVIINIGRGPLINEESFIKAVNEKKLKGAALDVFNVEPMEENHPFWDLENVIITPHLSGKTKKFFERANNIFLENFEEFEQGRNPAYKVDLERGY